MPDPLHVHQTTASIEPNTRTMMRYDANKKSAGVAYLIWFFIGWLGGHRFYLKRTGTAVTMLVIMLVSIPLAFVLVGFVGFAIIAVWHLVDAFLIPGMTRDYNNRLVTELVMRPNSPINNPGDALAPY